jgi:hypothetical protein
VESDSSQSARRMGHPWFGVVPADGGVTNVPRGLKPLGVGALIAALEALRHPKSRGISARLKSCPSRSWRFPNPQRDGVVESHPSQSARDPLTPLRRALGYGSCRPYGTRFHFLRLTQDLRPGLLSAAPPGLTCRGVGFASQLRFGSPQARGTTEVVP